MTRRMIFGSAHGLARERASWTRSAVTCLSRCLPGELRPRSGSLLSAEPCAAVKVRFPPAQSTHFPLLETEDALPYMSVRQRAGRPRLAQARRGKSGLHGTTVPGNARRSAVALGRKRVRDSATERIPPGLRLAWGRVRAKGCGKSAPRSWQQGRHGKPHRVQDRIGAAHGPGSGSSPGLVAGGAGQPVP
jgi:hypothetical protein